MRKDIFKASSMEIEEGEGARVRRLFPTEKQSPFDPFVLFDEFFLEPPAGFPSHPHRGFESITYLLQGAVRHQDSLGNDSTVTTGGSQIVLAGSGIIHSEMPGTKGLSHGIQLWINLPRKSKKLQPLYRSISREQIPEEHFKGGLIRTICGPRSPLLINTPLLYQDIQIKKGSQYQRQINKGYCGIVYVITGQLQLLGESIVSGGGVFWRDCSEIQIHAIEESRFMLLAGLPHHEDIVINGTFVD